jgi:hypothetical protein
MRYKPHRFAGTQILFLRRYRGRDKLPRKGTATPHSIPDWHHGVMTNKIALVTGVGRRQSIGSAITLALSREGWDVAFTYWEGVGGGTKHDTDVGADSLT